MGKVPICLFCPAECITNAQNESKDKPYPEWRHAGHHEAHKPVEVSTTENRCGQDAQEGDADKDQSGAGLCLMPNRLVTPALDCSVCLKPQEQGNQNAGEQPIRPTARCLRRSVRALY